MGVLYEGKVARKFRRVVGRTRRANPRGETMQSLSQTCSFQNPHPTVLLALHPNPTINRKPRFPASPLPVALIIYPKAPAPTQQLRRDSTTTRQYINKPQQIAVGLSPKSRHDLLPRFVGRR